GRQILDPIRIVFQHHLLVVGLDHVLDWNHLVLWQQYPFMQDDVGHFLGARIEDNSIHRARILPICGDDLYSLSELHNALAFPAYQDALYTRLRVEMRSMKGGSFGL